MELIDLLYQRIEPDFRDDVTGHDLHHIRRVHEMARHIQEKEGGDLEIIELAAILHDISDHKFNGGKQNEGGRAAKALLQELGYPDDRAELVKRVVDSVSYKGAGVDDTTDSIEAKIVQDADRLDALGAIGIARTFAYGGFKGQAMFDPDHSPVIHQSFDDYIASRSTTINHFYEKLLLLNERLHTETARRIGQERHELMEEYLRQFYREWNFKHGKSKAE